MSVSSIRYKAALNRYKNKPLSSSIAKPSMSGSGTGSMSVNFEGFNPDTGLQKFKNSSGDIIEAQNNNQHSAYGYAKEVVVSQGHVVG